MSLIWTTQKELLKWFIDWLDLKEECLIEVVINMIKRLLDEEYIISFFQGFYSTEKFITLMKNWRSTDQ